jgi:hypothetical protein
MVLAFLDSNRCRRCMKVLGSLFIIYGMRRWMELVCGNFCCAKFNTRKRTNRLQYSVCASARSYPQGIALQKLISI